MRFNSFISFATLIPSSHSSFDNTTTVVDDMEFVMERLAGRRPTIRGVSSVNPSINEFSPEFTSGLGEYSNGEQLSLFSSEFASLIVPIPNDHVGPFSIGFGSPFATMAGSMALIPIIPGQIGTGFRMILSPSDPLELCADRSMITVSPIAHTLFEASISLRRYDTDDFMSLSTSIFGIYGNPGPYSVIGEFELSAQNTLMEFPNEICGVIDEAIRSEGFSGRRVLEAGCADILPRLPTINLSFRSRGEHAGNIFFTPEDYIQVDTETGECRILINLLDEHHPQGYLYTLGLPFLEKIGVFLDYENGQIGFFEPR